MTQKLNLLLGFHSQLPSSIQKNIEDDSTKNYFNFLTGLIGLLNNHQSIKTTLHLSGNLISYLDKKHHAFSSSIRALLDRNQLELLSGGIYEPIFSFTPKEDRQTQLLLMNRLLNHTYGYTAYGAWITEFSWEPSLAFDLSKSRIQYTCLPKEFFMQAGLDENEISGYFLTEEEGRKIAVFPILYDLNSLINQHPPEEVIKKLLSDTPSEKNPLAVLFYKDDDTDINKLNWLKNFFQLIHNSTEQIQTISFNDYYLSNKPKGRIYLGSIQDSKTNDMHKNWKRFLLKYHEANLIHKKMLRVSKKINSAKEGKSRFKVIKEMINQAQDLLLKGQSNYAYWDSTYGGIYLPQERHNTYSNLIKAENLIDAASKHGSKWIQVYEIDYDCDGYDEIIIESESQNIYISPGLGGTILEHDYRPKNINITNTISRKKEPYHENNGNSLILKNGNLIYDNYLKLNLIDHFLDNNVSLEKCKNNNLYHLTKEIIQPYQVEKIKAKEETCKITFNTILNLTKLERSPDIEFIKQYSVRSGDSSLTTEYILKNKVTENIDFTFAVEFNLNITPNYSQDSYFYLNADKKNKTPNPELNSYEELKQINQISIFNKQLGLDLTIWCNKSCNIYRYPVETISYNYKKLENIYQGTTILLTWHVALEPNVPWELSIKQDIATATEEL